MRFRSEFAEILFAPRTTIDERFGVGGLRIDRTNDASESPSRITTPRPRQVFDVGIDLLSLGLCIRRRVDAVHFGLNKFLNSLE